jgi:7-keto-8-aminopelargonate synthetase-like enzyme
MGTNPEYVRRAYEALRANGSMFINAELRPDCTVDIAGKRLVNFSAVAYLDNSAREETIAALENGARKYGIGVQTAHFFFRCPEFNELQRRIGDICGGHALISPSTSIGSACFMYAVVKANDIVVFENQRMHGSFLMYGAIARERGTQFHSVSMIDRPVESLETIVELSKTCQGRVWYCTDAWDSSYGRHIPWNVFTDVTGAAPNVMLFVDDAHGFWAFGENGRGSFLDNVHMTNSTVMVVSMTKSFAGYGGALVFGDEKMCRDAELMVLPMYFQGGMSYPIVCADLTIARHAGDAEVAEQRSTLASNCRYVHDKFSAARLPNTAEPEIPLKFIHTGDVATAMRIAKAMRADGYVVMELTYPAVPRGHAGLRIAINARHTREHLDGMFDALLRAIGDTELPPFSKRVHDPLFDDPCERKDELHTHCDRGGGGGGDDACIRATSTTTTTASVATTPIMATSTSCSEPAHNHVKT